MRIEEEETVTVEDILEDVRIEHAKRVLNVRELRNAKAKIDKKLNQIDSINIDDLSNVTAPV